MATKFPTRIRLYGTWSNDVDLDDPLSPKRGDLLSLREDNQIFYRTWDMLHQNPHGTVVGTYQQVEAVLERQLDSGGVPVVTFQGRVAFIGTADPTKNFFVVSVTTTLDYELVLESGQPDRLVGFEPQKRAAFHEWRKLNTVGEPRYWTWRPRV